MNKETQEFKYPIKNVGSKSSPRFIAPEYTFINTEYFKERATFFNKHKVYTKLHPLWDKKEYTAFWDEEERRCIEGYSVGGVHITGDHYNYLNYSQIILTEGANKLAKVNKESWGKKSTSKSVAFPSFWDGDFHYFHLVDFARLHGLHICVGKSRRKGFSFKNGAICAKRANLFPNSTTLLAAYDSSYLYPEGTMGMTNEYLQFTNDHTDWYKSRSIDRQDHIRFGYYNNDSPDIERGFKSSVIAVSFGPSNPGAARGKSADLILVEEAGKAPNLLDFLSSTIPTVEDGLFVTGQIIIFGTGGGSDNNWAGFCEVFYNPASYGFISFDNIWDEEGKGQSCGLFVPVTQNLVGFMDEDGNSNIEEAKNFEEARREVIRSSSVDSSALGRHAMEWPFTPSEAFKRSSQSPFDVAYLSKVNLRVKNDPNIQAIIRAKSGIYEETKTGVVFKSNRELKLEGRPTHDPIVNYPIKPGQDPTGCVIEVFPPYKNSAGQVPKGLYGIWHDPFAHDRDGGASNSKAFKLEHSLGATYVYERVNSLTATKGHRLVANYIGRPETTDEYNEMLYLMCKRYNVKMMFENDRGDVKSFFNYKVLSRQDIYAMQYLEPEPEIFAKGEALGKTTGRGYGMHMTDRRIKHGTLLFRNLLNEVVGFDEAGKRLKFADYIWCTRLLEEAIAYREKGNFDAISAMLVGMFQLGIMKEPLEDTYYHNSTDNEPSNFFNRDLY